MLKTQTRRVVKGEVEQVRGRPEWHSAATLVHRATCQRSYCEEVDDGRLACGGFEVFPPGTKHVSASPYGSPGDFLWVRETWHHCPHCPTRWVAYRSGGWVDHHVIERSDGDMRPLRPKCAAHGWRPSIHMPRWASRISLRVEAVRVERLLAITEEDAKAEGVTPYTSIGPDQVVPGPGFNGARLGDQPHRLPFADLWRSINGAESWDANPWVWVITFARVDSIPEGAKARPIPFTAPLVRAILGSP